ncbi:membrane dipeptidase [Falsiroseomonas bella]|nr:membrane dipeptidase [Falsiroseomonas bella]
MDDFEQTIDGFAFWRRLCADPPTLDLLLRHLNHIMNLVGIDHVGFGNDMPALSSSSKADAIVEMSVSRYGSATADYVRAFGSTVEKRHPDEMNNARFLSRKTALLLNCGSVPARLHATAGGIGRPSAGRIPARRGGHRGALPAMDTAACAMRPRAACCGCRTPGLAAARGAVATARRTTSSYTRWRRNSQIASYSARAALPVNRARMKPCSMPRASR